jgi:hypothetical protein
MSKAFSAEVLAAFDRVEAAAHAAGVTELCRTPRIKAAEERVDELVVAYRKSSPPVLRDDVLETIAALERELMAQVRRVAPPPPSYAAFDELFEGIG